MSEIFDPNAVSGEVLPPESLPVPLTEEASGIHAPCEERIAALRAIVAEQERLLRDATPIFQATIAARQEMMAKEQEIMLEREAARATIVRLRSFLFECIKRLPPDVAAVAERNVKAMLSALPQVPPPRTMPADTVAPGVTIPIDVRDLN